LDAIIKNDIAKRFKVRNVEALRRIAAYLADNYCQEFVAKTVGELFGVSNHTAENYYSYLKEAFLLVGVNRFSYKSKDRVRNEKVYVVDTAFVTEREDNFSSDNLGWKLENIVCIELMRRHKPLFSDIFYYKETSSQIDFVIAKDGNVQELIQVSYDISSEKTLKREVRALINAANKLKCKKLTLITLEEHTTIEKDGYIINIIPATEWLLKK
jgi:predicted AAA+ superfamily ATPase